MRHKVTFTIAGPTTERELGRWADRVARELGDETGDHLKVDDWEVEETE